MDGHTTTIQGIKLVGHNTGHITGKPQYSVYNWLRKERVILNRSRHKAAIVVSKDSQIEATKLWLSGDHQNCSFLRYKQKKKDAECASCRMAVKIKAKEIVLFSLPEHHMTHYVSIPRLEWPSDNHQCLSLSGEGLLVVYCSALFVASILMHWEGVWQW